MRKTLIFPGFLLIFAVLFAIPLQTFAGGLTFGAKAGPMLLDVSGADDPMNGGVVFGTELGIFVGDLAVEGELTRTIDSGDDEIEIDTYAAYLAFRTPGPIYFKARGGVLKWELETPIAEDDDTGTSFGLGVGFSLAIIKLELDYTIIDDDINFLSIGLQF